MVKKKLIIPYWVTRALVLRAFWVTRALVLRAFWVTRALVLRAFWVTRALVLRAFWVTRALVLRAFWVTRAALFRIYWFIRSLRYRIKKILRTLFFENFYQFALARYLHQLFMRFRHRWKSLSIRIKALGRQDKLSIAYLDGDSTCGIFRYPSWGSLRSNVIPNIHVSSTSMALKVCEGKITTAKSIPLSAFRLSNVCIRGNTNFLQFESDALFPREFDPATEILPFEMNGLGRVFPREGLIKITRSKESRLPAGINLLGSSSGNYAHWLLEILPKALLLEKHVEELQIPYLVDEWIHPNMVESLKILANGSRPIIKIPRWSKHRVETLYDAQIHTYIPSESRHFFNTGIISPVNPHWFTFNLNSIELLQSAAIYRQNNTRNNLKLFLYRSPHTSGNLRHVTNIDELASIARHLGFYVFDPGKLSFSEQIDIFSSATHIISPVGAGLVNVLFSNPEVKAFILAPYYPEGNYNFFSQLLHLSGHKVKFILGKTMGGGHHEQLNYSISPEDLLNSLSGKESNGFIN